MVPLLVNGLAIEASGGFQKVLEDDRRCVTSRVTSVTDVTDHVTNMTKHVTDVTDV